MLSEELFKSIVDKMVRSYPHINDGYPCSFAVIDDVNDTHREFRLAVCHADISYKLVKLPTRVVTSFPATQPLEFKWFEYLQLNLFRKWSKHFKLIQTEHETPTPGVFYHYILIDGLDVLPANVLYNFCIASRHIVEYKECLAFWGRLTDAGVDPGLAYRLCLSFDIRSDYADKTIDVMDIKIGDLHGGGGHQPFDITSDPIRIMSGDLAGLLVSVPFQKDPTRCRPCNVIWGKADRAVVQSKFKSGSTIKEVLDRFKVPLGPVSVTPYSIDIAYEKEDSGYGYEDDDDDDFDYDDEDYENDDDE